MAVAVDWLDAYRDTSVDRIVAMYSPDGVVECACEGRKIIQGRRSLWAYWQHRCIERPALELVNLQMDGGAVVVSYRISSGIVHALLDIAEDGLITRCRCGPFEQCDRWGRPMQDTLSQLEKLRSDRLAAHLSVLASEVEKAMLADDNSSQMP